MTYKIQDEDGLRDATPEEAAEFEERAAAAVQQAAQAIQSAKSAYVATVRDLRERILNRLAGIGLAALDSEDQLTVSACVTARQRLLDITKLPAVVSATTLEELQDAVKGEYISIVLSVPANLKNAFDKVDQ